MMKWFELGLVVLTFATGITWLLDRLFFAKARKARAGLLDEDREPVVVDYARAFFPILAVVLAGIALGFYRGGLGMGGELLLTWAMYTGGLAGLGCLLAGSHPLSILTAIVVAPFKPFRLSIPTGAFAALVETRLRKPAYEDFLKLRDDAQSVKGWYRNRVTRVVLTFMLTNLGSMLGLWLTGLQVWGKVAG